MIGITCTDTYGDTVSFLTQWDVNISLTITCYDKITTPVFHFSNQSRTEALVVDEVTTSGNASAGYELTAKIPNVLLQEPYPIMMYLYDYLGNTGESGVPAKVRASARIPMRRRTKPSPYKYAETIDGAYFSEITALIQKKLDALDDGSIVYPDLTDLKSDCEDMQNAITKCQTSLRNEAAVDLDFDESTGEITLRNSVGAQTGDAVKIPTTLGISGISADTVQTDSDYYLVLYDEDGNELTRTLLPSSNSGIDSTTIDDSLSSTSEQPVQNKVINSAIEAINTNVGTMSDLQVSADNLVAAINKIDDKAKAAAATTYASTSEAGIVKLYSVDGKNTSGLNVDAADGSVWIGTNSDKGTQKTSSGEIATAAADVTDIDAAINSYKPIVPSTLSYAVQSIGGTLTELKTQSQDSYISAINEIKTDIDDIVASGIGTASTMTTAMYENVGTSESMLTLPHKISEILEFILAKVNGLQSHIYEFPTTNLTLNYPEIVTGDVSSEAKAPGVIASIPMPCGVYHINIPANSTYFYIRSFTIRDKDDSSTSYTVKYTDKSGEGRFLTGHNYWAYFGDQGSKLLYSDVFGQQPIPCNYSITDGQLSSSIAAKPGIFLCDEADGQYTITYPVLSMYNDESGETTQIKFDLNGNIYTRCDSTGIGGESWTEWAKVVPDVDSALSFTSSNPVQNKVISEKLSDKADAWTDGSGFAGGVNSSAGAGGAIGWNATTTSGGAVGTDTISYAGFAGGAEAESSSNGAAVGYKASCGGYGGAVGYSSSAMYGGAVGAGASEEGSGFAGGNNAKVTNDNDDGTADGVAIGANAKTTALGAVQLGTGTNSTKNTLQFRTYQLLDANGKIPTARLPGSTSAGTSITADDALSADSENPVQNKAIAKEINSLKFVTTNSMCSCTVKTTRTDTDDGYNVKYIVTGTWTSGETFEVNTGTIVQENDLGVRIWLKFKDFTTVDYDIQWAGDSGTYGSYTYDDSYWQIHCIELSDPGATNIKSTIIPDERCLTTADVESTLSTTSVHPVQNQAITNAIGEMNKLNVANTSTLVEAVNAAYAKATATTGTTSTGSTVTVENEITSTSTNPVTSSAIYSALNGKISSSEKGTASGVVPLNSSKKIDTTYLPLDTALSSTSTNPVQNKVINTAINNAVANSDNWDKGYEWCNTFSNNFSNSSYLSVDEIASDMGNVASLETTATNLVGAINEIKNAQTTGGVTVDEALSSTSTNPVQNKTVYTALNSGYYGVATMSVGTDTVTYSATVTPAPLIAAGLRVTINFSGFKAGLNNYLSVNSSTAFPIYQNGIDLFVAEETISYGECLDLVLVADDTSVDNYHWEIINAGEILNMNLQISVDTALSSTSTNPVQNKIVNTAINTINNKLGTTTMGTTATTITGAIAELKNAQSSGTGADSSFDGSADFDIIPADSETYDLGNATNAWNCVYANIVDASQVSVEEVATNTIELGSVVLNITDFNQGRITYVICDTEQDNTAKIGTPTSYTDFSMTNEMHFAVQFTNGLAENTSATLNINNTAAYPITIDGTNYYTGSVPAGGVLEVVYYDNSFIVVNPNNDTLGNSAESAKLNTASSGKNAVKVSSQSALTSAISNSSNDGCVIEFSGTSSTTQYILYLDKISSSITNLTIRGASSSRASNYLKIALYNSTAPTYNAKFKLTIERTNVEIAQPNIYKTAIPTLVFNNCNVTATLNNLSTFTAGKLIQATELVLNNCSTMSKITETSAKIDTIFYVFWAEKIKVIGGYLNTAGRPYDSDICVNLLGSSGKTAGESCISDGCQISQYDLTTSSTYSNAGKHCVISAYAFDVSGCTIKNSCTTTYATNYCLFCTDIVGTAVTAGTVFENNTVSGYSSMFIHCETIKGNTFTTSGTLMLSLDDGSIISDNTFTNTAVTLQGATSGERVQYWDNIASSITLGSNISRTLVNRKVERIGTWIDGTPIWRVMFRYALEDTDREDFTNNSTMSLTSYCKTVSSSSDYCIYLRWGATLISGETPCLIDDMNLVPTSNIECDVDTSQVSEAYIKSASPTYLYGWIEFATPESKLAS